MGSGQALIFDEPWYMPDLHGPPPVQPPVLDRLRGVIRADLLRDFQVGDRPRHLEDPVVRPGGEVEAVHRPLEHPDHRPRRPAEAT